MFDNPHLTWSEVLDCADVNGIAQIRSFRTGLYRRDD
jgi:hypothetical protein